MLDLIFIGGMGFGIVCSAATTVVAEAVSAVLSVGYIYQHIPLLRIKRMEFTMDGSMLKKTLQFGTITALQQSCQPVGKLLIQGAVNTLGVDVIAAFNAVNRVDDFAFTPEQSIAHGITTFTAQNRGAKKPKRIHDGFRKGLQLEFSYWIFIFILIFLFRRPIMNLFVSGREADTVIDLGNRYLGTMAWFYLLPAFTNGIQGFFRGMGKLKMTLFGTLIQTSIRVLCTWILAPVWGIYGIALACAAGWSVMLMAEVPYYFYYKKSWDQG